ncbi:MAG: DUF1893 domain-containing protein [Candidatus Bathyarchaeota archaeon]
MPKEDLELAKSHLFDEGSSLVIVKKGKVIFETKKQGITGFLEAIETLEEKLVSSSIADKIVGVAAAMLCVYSGISSVFAITISESGMKLFKENNIQYEFSKKVKKILNRNKTNVCPFEKLAMNSINPENAYQNLKSFANQISKKSKISEC